MDSSGTMIAFHLSVPYRIGIVKEEDVYAALKQGSLDGIPSPAKVILASLFTENSPASILKAVHECGSSLENAQKLYKEIVEKLSYHPSPEWEQVIL
ncbi:MAG: hypothetical protein ACYCT9_13225 [Leptospirillum sp.]